MSEISPEMIKKIADLAKLSFADDEKQTITRQLTGIVSYVEKLNEIDTTGVVPLSNPFDIDKPLRADIPASSLSTDDVLENAPQSKMDYFVVPKVI
jgi:aspartyl-tRNA(Asn)/glutamyl-tRNA(Gln) amidotransferase subunit C